MPKLNLKGDETEGEGQPSDMGSEPEQPMTQPPTLREMPSEGGMSPLLQIVLALLIVGAVTFALNYFGIVHLWGKKAQVVETLAPSEPTAPAEAEGVKPSESGNVPGTTPAPTPTPEAGTKTSPSTPTPIPGEPGKIGKASPARPTPVVPRAERKVPTPLPGGQAHERTGAAPSGGRNYTIQVSSWLSIAKANAEVASLEQAGLSAFVEDAEVAGRTMHRVRVGHYSTFREASEAAASLRNTVGEGAWVDRLR